MKILVRLFALLLIIILTGCVTVQEPIGMRSDALAQSDRVGVVMTVLPTVDTSFPGAGCLLCIAAASAANSTLTTHTKTLSSEEVKKIKVDVVNALKQKGLTNVVLINEDIVVDTLPKNKESDINVANKDYSGLAKQHNVDKLLVINITALGFERTYSSYFPTSDPKGIVYGAGYLVNASNNTYEWYLPIKINKSTDLEWDEPPQFPGLTNAYYQAIELAKDEIIKPLR